MYICDLLRPSAGNYKELYFCSHDGTKKDNLV
jgi:hypothetical protein